MEDYIKLVTKLQLGKSRKVEYVQDKEVDNIEKINIDTNLPKLERMINFLKEVKNPYIFTVNGRKVKFEYSNNDLSISQCMENLLRNKKNF